MPIAQVRGLDIAVTQRFLLLASFPSAHFGGALLAACWGHQQAHSWAAALPTPNFCITPHASPDLFPKQSPLRRDQPLSFSFVVFQLHLQHPHFGLDPALDQSFQ